MTFFDVVFFFTRCSFDAGVVDQDTLPTRLY